jgi:hypothetical protein
MNAELIRIKWLPETGDRFTELREWIAAVMQPDIPPIYRLVDPGELRIPTPIAFQDEVLLGMRSARRTDSGVLEITFSDGRRFLDAGPRIILAELARLARAEDLRTFTPIDDRRSRRIRRSIWPGRTGELIF